MTAIPARPKYKAGQTVFIILSSKLNAAPKGKYTIVRALPDAGGLFRYRIKSDLEAYERVVEEGQLGLEE